MGICMSTREREWYDLFTACSYQFHHLDGERKNDYDFCSHPLCVYAVIGHYKRGYTFLKQDTDHIIQMKDAMIQKINERIQSNKDLMET